MHSSEPRRRSHIESAHGNFLLALAVGLVFQPLFVIVVDGHEGSEDEALSSARAMATALLEYLPASQAARIAAKLNKVPRRKVYEMLGGEMP